LRREGRRHNRRLFASRWDDHINEGELPLGVGQVSAKVILFYACAGHCRTINIIVIDFVILCTISIVVIVIARRAVAIIFNNGKMPAHWQRQRHHCNKGNNAIATMAKTPVHWQQQHHHNKGNNASLTMARCLRIDDARKPCEPLLWGSTQQTLLGNTVRRWNKVPWVLS
jgi:hypothetical protein